MATAPSPHDAFNDVLHKFKSRLSKKELEDFKFSSFDDVRVAVYAIQEEQGRKSEMMHLPRILGFLEAMEQYGKVVEVFLNASSFLCLIWGPMKFCLQARMVFIGNYIPRFSYSPFLRTFHLTRTEDRKWMGRIFRDSPRCL